MTSKIKEFNNLLVIRNHLAKISQSNLIKMYDNYDFYLAFLNSISILLENDSAFLLFDDGFIEKIFSIIQIHRFDAGDEGVKEVTNEIIECLNTIKSYPNNLKNTLKNNYLAYQESERKATFYTTQGLMDSISYDAIVFSALKDDNLDSIQYDEHYLLSLNYIMSECPELFHDSLIKGRAKQRLEAAKKRTKPLGKQKRLIIQMEKDLKKEE